MKYRACLRIVAIALNSLKLSSNALPICCLCNGIDVFVKNEVPLADVLANNLFGLPAKNPLCRGRPARHAKVAVPLDHCHGRVFDMKR